jgi:dTDP-4-amino-4,6-dideoxygalactose transaminase
MPVSDRLAGEVISLPIHPYLDEKDQSAIIESIKSVTD